MEHHSKTSIRIAEGIEHFDVGLSFPDILVMSQLPSAELTILGKDVHELFKKSLVSFTELLSKKTIETTSDGRTKEIPRVNLIPYLYYSHDGKKNATEPYIPLRPDTLAIEFASVIYHLLNVGISGTNYDALLHTSTPIRKTIDTTQNFDGRAFTTYYNYPSQMYSFDWGSWFTNFSIQNVEALKDTSREFINLFHLNKEITDKLTEVAEKTVKAYTDIFAIIQPKVSLPREACLLLVVAQTILFYQKLIANRDFQDKVIAKAYSTLKLPVFLCPDNFFTILNSCFDLYAKKQTQEILDKNVISLDQIIRSDAHPSRFINRIGSFTEDFMDKIFSSELNTIIDLSTAITFVRWKLDELLIRDKGKAITEGLKQLYGASVLGFVTLTPAERFSIQHVLFTVNSDGTIPYKDWNYKYSMKEACVTSITTFRQKYAIIFEVISSYLMKLYKPITIEDVFKGSLLLRTTQKGGLHKYFGCFRDINNHVSLRAVKCRSIADEIVSCTARYLTGKNLIPQSGQLELVKNSPFSYKGDKVSTDQYCMYRGQFQDLLEIIARNGMVYTVYNNLETKEIYVRYSEKLLAYSVCPPSIPEEPIPFFGVAKTYSFINQQGETAIYDTPMLSITTLNSSNPKNLKIRVDQYEWPTDGEQCIECDYYSNGLFQVSNNLTELLFAIDLDHKDVYISQWQKFYTSRIKDLGNSCIELPGMLTLPVTRFRHSVGLIYSALYKDAALRHHIDIQKVPSALATLINTSNQLTYPDGKVLSEPSGFSTETVLPVATQMSSAYVFKFRIKPIHFSDEFAETEMLKRKYEWELYFSSSLKAYKVTYDTVDQELTVVVWTSDSAKSLLTANLDEATALSEDEANIYKKAIGYQKLNGKDKIFGYHYADDPFLNGGFLSPATILVANDNSIIPLKDVFLSDTMKKAIELLNQTQEKVVAYNRAKKQLEVKVYKDKVLANRTSTLLHLLEALCISSYKMLDNVVCLVPYSLSNFDTISDLFNFIAEHLLDEYSSSMPTKDFLYNAGDKLGGVKAAAVSIANTFSLLSGSTSQPPILTKKQKNVLAIYKQQNPKLSNKQLIDLITDEYKSTLLLKLETLIKSLDPVYRSNFEPIHYEPSYLLNSSSDNRDKWQRFLDGEVFLNPPIVFSRYLDENILRKVARDDVASYVSKTILNWMNQFSFWGTFASTMEVETDKEATNIVKN